MVKSRTTGEDGKEPGRWSSRATTRSRGCRGTPTTLGIPPTLRGWLELARDMHHARRLMHPAHPDATRAKDERLEERSQPNGLSVCLGVVSRWLKLVERDRSWLTVHQLAVCARSQPGSRSHMLQLSRVISYTTVCHLCMLMDRSSWSPDSEPKAKLLETELCEIP